MLDLGRSFLQAVERAPDLIGLASDTTQYSYEQWALEIGAVQRYLKDKGLRRGDRVLTVLQNRTEAATLHWACQASGITIVPVNWRSKPEEIDFFVENAEPALSVVEPVSWENWKTSQSARHLATLTCGPTPLDGQADTYEAIRSQRAMPQANASPEDWSVMLYTSGTTGRPKGVPRRQRAERAAAIAHVAQNQYRMHETTVGVMPLYHTMGVRTLLAMGITNGTYVAFPRWNPEAFIAAIESQRATHLYLVPTLYHDMLNAAGFRPERVSSVRKLGFAGAPMHDALLLRLQETFSPDLFVNHYGSSEIYTYAINQQAVKKPGSAGRQGLNARLRVVPFDAGETATDPSQTCMPRQEGQIICDMQSDEAFEGYWKRPEVNTRSIRDGWFFTGDTGYFDEEGELFVTGRVDDMIISAGENISPVEIESVLSLHERIDEVAVVGLKDERLGQKVVAFIKPVKDRVPAEELDAHCRDSDLMNFKRPREYIFVKSIPKSPVGKILRRLLVAGEFEPL
jgi:2-furoate---CoA ligase